MNGITSTTALWYASRATGVVSLLLLSLVMILGLVVNRQGRLPGLPRFGVTSLHRNVSLLAVVFVAVHVITAIADPFVTIRIAAAVIPFTSAYEPFWLGLGAVSLDLIIALIVTSLARARIGRRTWRSLPYSMTITVMEMEDRTCLCHSAALPPSTSPGCWPARTRLWFLVTSGRT